MFKLALAVLLCSQALARPNIEIDPHVVGGKPATEGHYPFIVSLREIGGFNFCGGALITNRTVVTAAHCVHNLRTPIKIGAGSIKLSSQKLYDVDKIIVHPSYETRENTNDIAVLILKKPLKLTDKIQTINYPVTEDLVGKNVTGLGWGRTSAEGPPSSTLLYLNRPIINNQECARRLKYKIRDSHICLGSETNFGMCFGDSGSPLLYKGANGKNFIAGVVSWGIPCAKGYPDVFTRVSYFTDWIKHNTA